MSVGELFDPTVYHIKSWQQVPQHFGPASGQCWTPSSPSPKLSIPKRMARQSSSTGLLYTFYACTIQRIHAHGTRASPMYNIVITGLSTVQLAIAPFRSAWDSSHYYNPFDHQIHPESCSPRIELSNDVSCASNGDSMPKLCPWDRKSVV